MVEKVVNGALSTRLMDQLVVAQLVLIDRLLDELLACIVAFDYIYY